MPDAPHRSRALTCVVGGASDTALALDDAVATAATGDIWLFRGRSMAE